MTNTLLDRLSSPAFLVIALACAVLVVLRVVRPSLFASTAKVACKPLLTRAEHRFLLTLVDALPGYLICPQVAMGALLKVDDSVDRKQFQATRNRFSQKIVDYAVIDPATGKVIALIGLDDSSHSPDRDRFRDAMLDRAGYRIERFPNRPFPDVPAVRQRLIFVPKEALA